MRLHSILPYANGSTMARLNVVLFGATGHTGRATIPALHKLTKKDGRNLTWGIAGRSRDKLQNVLKDASRKLGVDLSQTPVFIADAANERSLNEMAANAQVVINMCGPFRFYGEPVVKACIAHGTHHLDISGEPQFIETIQLNYADAAEKNKCYVISSCGFDSIPADLGVVFTREKFRGVLHSVEAYLQTTSGLKEARKGPAASYATWESLVNGMRDQETLKMIRRKLSEKRTKAPPKRDSEPKRNIFKNKLTGQWSLPFRGADASVVKRSQQYFYEHENKLPIKFDMYITVNSASSAIASLFVYMSLITLSKSDFGKKLLLNNPKLFSFGWFSHDPPIEEETKQSNAQIYMMGKGCLDINAKNNKNLPKDVIVSRVAAQDAFYGNTGTIATVAAITLLEESDKLPNNGGGGVFTPAAAFSRTSLIQRLNQNGITFKIISKI